MRYAFSLLNLALCLFFALPGKGQDYVPGEILVQLRPSVRASAWANQQGSLRAAGSGFVLDEAPLSAPMHIWKLRFDPQTQDEQELLARLQKDPAVLAAQFNHYIELRSVKPNDPEFAKQWHLSNTGQEGGTPGLDLGMLQAWDITTGGLSPNGDTIVVCVIDDGIDVTHRDLQANLWKNPGEIPNNNRDDDENGFVDDHEGWNVRRGNDDLSEDASHGTEVAGFIGAVGNNNLGITGINWNIKIMGVLGGYNSSTEDVIIQAYNYPYIQRRLYNQTGGKKGAFVVATNASWGFSRTQADRYPIWCNYFDSLGVQGILNIVATSNSNIDVDIAGDMPGSCPSPYVIAVTSITRTGALTHGYGKISVDLAALGDQTLTTAKNNGYTQLSGTSFSTPQVTGAVGLLYSAPCPTLASLARRDPKAAALWIRKLILENVKPLATLSNVTSSGGYLQVYNSLLALGKECGACPSLVSIASTAITVNSARLTWTGNDSIQRVDLRYRVQGSNTWTTVERVVSPFNFSGLQSCTTYEYQFKTYCRNSTVDFEETFRFRTDGCCEPPSQVEIPTEIFSTAIFRWPAITAASGYTFRYRVVGTTQWTVLTPPFGSVNLRSLQACSTYEFQIRSECTGGTSSEYSRLFTFKTRNCGACLDRNYCKEAVLIDQAEQEWLTSVQVGNFINRSVRNGYGDFTGLKGLDLRSGQSYAFKATIGYKGQLFNEYVVAWIDYNQDGTFSNRELVYNSGAKKDSVFNGTINVPAGTLSGSTRMRVILRYNSEPSTCFTTSNFYGEVEDYCVYIDQVSTSTQTLQSVTQLQIAPNPFVDEFAVKFRLPYSAPNAQLEVWNAQGQFIQARSLNIPGNLVMEESISCQGWPKGLYLVRLRTGIAADEIWSKVLKVE